MIRIRRGKNVIRNVAAHVVYIVLPLNRRRHALDLADQVTLVENATRICIALDVVLGTGPSPLRAPLDASARCTVEIRALRTRRRGVFAPEVV
jgi:hypothetical protein